MIRHHASGGHRSHARPTWFDRLPPSWAVYLAMCVVLGGASAGGAAANWLLQLTAILLLVREYLRPQDGAAPLPDAFRVALFTIAVIAVVQLFQVPASWLKAPVRDTAQGVLATIAAGDRWSPVSSTPINAVASLLSLLPAATIAVLLLRRERDAIRPAMVVVALVTLSIVLGLAQILTGGDSPFYLYSITNRDAPVGFFANRNHFATLVVLSMPAAALVLQTLNVSYRKLVPIAAIGAAGVAFVTVLLIGSDTGIMLFLPTLIASYLLYRNVSITPWLTIIAILAVGVGMIMVMANAASLSAILRGGTAPQLDRSAIWSATLTLIGGSLPLGTGLGSFLVAYANHEDPLAVTSIYVNHAHNDYLEIVAELGLIGITVIAVFLAWWTRRAMAVWRSTDSAAKSGVIMSGIVLMHSGVDYPARTAAVSALFAASIALMMRRADVEANRSEPDGPSITPIGR